MSPEPRRTTPIQDGIRLVLAAYTAACGRLTLAERDVLRDVIAARLARDWLAERGELPAEQERAA
jgi:hypothetical protein